MSRRALVEMAVPVYNEEAQLEPNIRRLRWYLDQRFPLATLVTIVDNASTDTTWERALHLERSHPGVRAVHLAEKGRGGALKRVWAESDSPVVAYMDVDLEPWGRHRIRPDYSRERLKAMMTGVTPPTRAGRAGTTRSVSGPGLGAINAAVAAAAAGLGLVLWMGFDVESSGALRAKGGVTTFIGQEAGLAGAYLMLIMLLLVARIPWVERAAGQDRLVRWHRLLGQWPVYLLSLHAILITVGYAAGDRIGVFQQFKIFLQSYPDVLAGTVALGLIIAVAVSSIRAARRRMRYETWWSAHLYMYLALALAFAHQIANGQSFVGHPLARVFWAVLWSVTAGVVLIFRFLMPLWRSVYHGLTVVGVQEEASGVVSVVCRGRHLDRLRVEGGQFFHWRFLARGHWWLAHPYSVSALPRADLVRLTVKDLGDHSRALSRLPIGTRVGIEGPYGAFTRRAARAEKVLLLGAGVGVTAIRSLLEHLDPAVDVTLVLRATTEDEIVFRQEFDSLMARRPGRTVVLVGSRRKNPLDHRQLAKLVPDIAERDVYVCGPEPLSERLINSARALGVPERSIHCEQFAF